MIISADGALGIARLNLGLAIQQQQGARSPEEFERMAEWVRHCEHVVKGWEERLAAESNPDATGGTMKINPSGA